MQKKDSSRRAFLKQASVAGGALSMGSFATVKGGAGEPPERGSIWERPPKQQGNNLNLILIVSDTFRRDNLACYGSKWVDCPNLNRLAEDSVIFDDFYPEGMPTVPIRRTLMTGRRIFPFHFYRQHEPVQLPGWHNLYNEDITLSETLLEAGYIPALISDIPHLQRPGRNFHRGYQMYEWVRGQEWDYYGTVPHGLLDVRDMATANYLAQIDGLHRNLSQYKANRERWRQEGEALVELVARAAIRWLKENHAQKPFFLHLEAFDPHEPWDPPGRFLEKYLPGAEGPSWIEPPYQDIKLPEEVSQRMRANYPAEATCVDFWLGKVVDTIGNLGLFEDSVVVFLSDQWRVARRTRAIPEGPRTVAWPGHTLAVAHPYAGQAVCRETCARIHSGTGSDAYAAFSSRPEISPASYWGEFLAVGHRRAEKPT